MTINISDDSKRNINRLIATISQLPELDSNNFLDDNPSKALELVLTLKHYANPLAGYPVDKDAEEGMDTTLKCLAEPNNLQPYLRLSEDEKEYVRQIIRVRLDKLAQEIMLEKKISEETIKSKITLPSINSSQAEKAPEKNWWETRPPKEQEQLIARRRAFNEEQQRHLRQSMNNRYGKQDSYSDEQYYYQMSFIDAELTFLALRSAFEISPYVFQGMAHVFCTATEFAAAIGSSSSSSFSSSSKIEITVETLGVAAFIALGISAIVGSAYALKKAFNSIYNILCGEKVLRSLFRLGSTAGGAYAGVYAGAFIGAVLGSMVPGIGTAAGAIIGMIFCAGIGAGLSALTAKYTAKLISSQVHHDKLNPTNPDKWNLTDSQKCYLVANNIKIEDANAGIKRIYDEKSKIDFWGSFFWTSERKAKNRLNWELQQIKSGKVQIYPPRMTAR